jgi:hypothetical protein
MDNGSALAQLVDMAKAAIETGAGGQLNDAQSSAFVQEIQDKSSFGSQIRTERRRAPKGTIEKMGIGSRLIRGHKENTDDGYRAGIKTDDVAYDASELWLPFEITRNFLHENIEGPAAEARILDLMTNQWALDLDDLRINGDEESADPMLKEDDGLIKLVTDSEDTHHVKGAKVKDSEGEELKGAMGTELFFALLYATPNKHVNSGRLRWFMSPSRWVTWIESLINRQTAVGDAALTAKDLYPLGIPPFMASSSTAGGATIPGVPGFSDDLIVLADPQNFCEVITWDVERYSVKAGQDWELTTRRKDGHVFFIKRDFILLEDDAISYADELSAIGA